MRVDIYINKRNVDKWNKIPNKSRWVNTLLDNSDSTAEYGSVRKSPVGPVVPVLSESLPKSDRFKRGVCKIHGLPLDSRGRCLQKGCKYA